MDPQRYRQVDAAFGKLLELPSGDRRRVLEEYCRDDDELRRELVELLHAAEESGEFLTAPYDPGPLTEGAAAKVDVGSVVGGYRLFEALGEGGAAKVYRAEALSGGSPVALKLSHLGSGAVQTQRFRQEWQILVQLDHPSIARCHDYGTTRDGRLYLVMELVEGPALDRFCDERRLDVPQRLSLFHEVCQAVGEAHRVGIVHRDLKPQNVLVSRDGEPKLVDFGIAKPLDPTRLTIQPQPSTASSIRLFTPGYTSPEQLTGADVTPASDVYALGILLFELLVGRTPYDLGPTPLRVLEISRAVCEETPLTLAEALERLSHEAARAAEEICLARSVPGLRELRSELGDSLEEVVGKALRKEPRERYASARELADDVRRLLAGRPVLAGAGSARRLLVGLRESLERLIS